MEKINKQAVADHLREAITREELPNREAARYLNLHPCYISMALNPKNHDSIGSKAWTRLNEWHENREKISEFVIPEGEEIWKPAEKAQKTTENADITPYDVIKALSVKKPKKKGTRRIKEPKVLTESSIVEPIIAEGADEHSPEAVLSDTKEKNGKSVVLALAKAEIKLLNDKFKLLYEQVEKIRIEFEEERMRNDALYHAYQAEFNRIRKEGDKNNRSQIIIFQRNIYPK